MNITQAHAFCAKLPGAEASVKWAFGDSAHAVFSVGGKMFAIFTTQKGKLVDGLTFKADDARFLELTDREGIVPAPYLARARWVRMDRIATLSTTEAKVLLSDAHRVVMQKLSKKKQREIEESHA